MVALSNCKQASMTILAYYVKLKLLWDEPNNYEQLLAYKYGMKIEFLRQKEEIKGHQFLLGLDDTTFSTMGSSILQIYPLPSINEVYAKITTKEHIMQVRKFTENRGQMVAFAAIKVSSGTTILRCAHCHKQGHDASSCSQLIGYPD